MGINRIRLQAGSTEEMAKAEAAAAQNPELDKIRQQLFGEGYVQDIGKGEGIAQYYTGFGLPQSLTFTQPGEEVAPVADVTQPVVDTGGGGGGDGGATGITSASTVQPTSDPFLASGAAGGARLPTMDQAGAIAAMTQDPAYSLPGQSDPFLASGAAGGARLPATQATTTLPSGDIFATDDPMLAEKMDYTPTTESQSAWEKVQSGLSNIKDFTSKYGKQAVNFFMGMANPMLGMAARLVPEETPIDKFNREYALGGDLYQNVVAQSGDPNFEGRIQGYADDLIAGTGEGKDPFGINTVSAYGDYPEYATETFNELTEKAKQRATEGKELSQFDKDRLEYYGHVSGLTGKTNIPGTPLMVDDLPFKTTPDAADTVTTIPVEEQETGAKFDDSFFTTTLPTREEQEMLDEITVEEIANIADRQPEVIEQKKNELADIYDKQVERGERDDDSAITSDINKAKAVIDMPPMLGDVGGSMDRDSAPTGVDAGSASVQDFDDYGTYDPAPTVTGPTYGPHGGSGADRDDKGKIVCTMMNESYGFGSFRNKIWLKHSKNLVPEYQIGYHKIFLPLVRLSKKNKLLKKTLEHIAVHRTIDIRQEARGKMHLLGRVYRKILEPICYIVGKHAKR